MRVAVAGLCRSQINEILGLKGPDPHLPHTLGHEGAGRIEAVGKGVRKVKAGDRVVLTWIKAGGLDVSSTRYQDSAGRFVYSGAVSTFLEYAVVSENRVIPIPSHLPYPEAAVLGCAVLTGAGMVLRTLKIRPRKTLAVFGAGGVGLSAIAAARLSGASSILAFDVSAGKLQLARRLGAKTILLDGTKDVLGRIRSLTGGRGLDYAIEASGDPRAMEQAFLSIKDGGTCLIAGNPKKGRRIRIDPYSLIRGKKIYGSWGGGACPDDDIPRYARLHLKGSFDLHELIGRQYPLDDINRAVIDFSKESAGRILIKVADI